MPWLPKNNFKIFLPIQINYIFFGLYFFFIAFLHVYHLLLIEAEDSYSRYFFLAHTLAQCLLETLLLLVIGNLFSHFFRVFGSYLFSFIVLILLFAHFIDFPLVRFMDMSIWYTLDFITKESPQNFLEILYASNVSIPVWIFSAFCILMSVLAGFLFYKLSQKWTVKKSFAASYSAILIAIASLASGMLMWDYLFLSHLNKKNLNLYLKSLPWKQTLINSNEGMLALASPLIDNHTRSVQSLPSTLERRPDIFLFIIESLREDYINQQNAPHLNNFKTNNLSFDLALSNANATHVSWYSLFHSKIPLFWGTSDSNELPGSAPLQFLKAFGYQINVISSARLAYYQMNEVIFGKNSYLADNIHVFEEGEACQRDSAVIESLIHQLKNTPEGGRVFVVFLDSTHLDYSWPKDFATPFGPIETKINYLKAAFSLDVEKIINRYKSALYYIDSLMEKFFSNLSKSEKEKAIIVITSDHGEEFYENGRLFHASHLSHQQIHVPLYYRFGNGSPKRYSMMSCHMDIFPSILHYLVGENTYSKCFHGQSIFETNRRPYTIIGRYNASRPPVEFCVHQKDKKLIARFSDQNILNCKSLEILGIKNLEDQLISQNDLLEKFKEGLDYYFKP